MPQSGCSSTAIGMSVAGPASALPPLPVASGAGGGRWLRIGDRWFRRCAIPGGFGGSQRIGRSHRIGRNAAEEVTSPTTSALPVSRCSRAGCKVQLRNCSTATGTAAAGPAQGMNKSNLCMAAVACVRQTGCAEPDGDVSKCYCGPDRASQENGDCYIKGLGTGACRAQFEAAAETTDSMEMQRPDDQCRSQHARAVRPGLRQHVDRLRHRQVQRYLRSGRSRRATRHLARCGVGTGSGGTSARTADRGRRTCTASGGDHGSAAASLVPVASSPPAV